MIIFILILVCCFPCCGFDFTEPEFIERIMLKYNDAAAKSGSLIISTCGFDSIPADLGNVFTRQAFREQFPADELALIDSFLTVSAPKGASGHYATFESAVEGISSVAKLMKIRKELRKQQDQGGNNKPQHIGKAPKPKSLYWEKRLNKYAVSIVF